MTDEQLQTAIDKTALNANASSGDVLRGIYREHLQALLKVQAIRAGLHTQVGLVRPGSYQEIK